MFCSVNVSVPAHTDLVTGMVMPPVSAVGSTPKKKGFGSLHPILTRQAEGQRSFDLISGCLRCRCTGPSPRDLMRLALCSAGTNAAKGHTAILPPVALLDGARFKDQVLTSKPRKELRSRAFRHR